MFEKLQDIYVDSSKHEPALSLNIYSIDTRYDTVKKEKNNEDT